MTYKIQASKCVFIVHSCDVQRRKKDQQHSQQEGERVSLLRKKKGAACASATWALFPNEFRQAFGVMSCAMHNIQALI
jgi:hypothetical protein